jgi:hypothetical protein
LLIAEQFTIFWRSSTRQHQPFFLKAQENVAESYVATAQNKMDDVANFFTVSELF